MLKILKEYLNKDELILSSKLGANVFKHIKLNVVFKIDNLNFGK